MNMLVILDRDGVINYDSDEYIKSPAEWIPLPGSLEAVAKLNKMGHQVVVATNQSGVGRGYFTEETLEQIHAKMNALLAAVGGHFDGIYYCPHKPEDGCGCRKPKVGLLKQIAKDFTADLTQTILIGDALRDIQAAQNVGAQPILVMSGKGAVTLEEIKGLANIPVFDDLKAVVENYAPLFKN